MAKIKSKLFNLLNLGNIRNKILAQNIAFTSLFQFGTVLLSLVTLPVSLSLLPVSEYGIWLTISSILMWIGYFDLGLGTGLKNKLSEAMAKSDHTKAKQLISTAYLTLIFVMSLVIVAFLISLSYIDYIKFFGNLKEIDISEKMILETISVVIYLFILRFIFQLINPILDALQKLYWTKIIFFVSQLIILVTLILIKYFIVPNIFIMGIIFSLSPLICLLIGSIIFFAKHQFLLPSIFEFKLKLVKELFSMGLKFFLIQINMIVLFQSSNFIIVNNIGPSEVVKYNVAFNLFSMMNIAFSTVAAPYWSAYSNAWFQKDIDWIKRAQKKIFILWLFLAIISFFVLILSKSIYSLWVGDRVSIPFSLSLSVYFYMLLFTFGMIYNTFINSTGKVLLQTVSLSILTIIYIPLVQFLLKHFQLGLSAIPISLSIVSIYTVIIAPIQSNLLLKGRAKGIFNK
jgi:O-antigen/teichoic acid export membrane protein